MSLRARLSDSGLKRRSLHEPLSAPEQDENEVNVTHHELFDTKLEKLAIHTNASWMLDRR